MKHLAWQMSLVLIFVIPVENSIMITNVGTLGRMVGMVVAAVWLLSVVIEGELRRPGLLHLAVLQALMA